MAPELIGEAVSEQNGNHTKVLYFRGWHPEIDPSARLHFGWAGRETIVEIPRVRSNTTVGTGQAETLENNESLMRHLKNIDDFVLRDVDWHIVDGLVECYSRGGYEKFLEYERADILYELLHPEPDYRLIKTKLEALKRLGKL